MSDLLGYVVAFAICLGRRGCRLLSMWWGGMWGQERDWLLLALASSWGGVIVWVALILYEGVLGGKVADQGGVFWFLCFIAVMAIHQGGNEFLLAYLKGRQWAGSSIAHEVLPGSKFLGSCSHQSWLQVRLSRGIMQMTDKKLYSRIKNTTLGGTLHALSKQ